jgi:hypothetical protein
MLLALISITLILGCHPSNDAKNALLVFMIMPLATKAYAELIGVTPQNFQF